MMFAKIWAIAVKDFRVFTSDRKGMVISYAVPVVIASFFGLMFAAPPKVSKMAIEVVSSDSDPTTQAIVSSMKSSDAFTVKEVSESAAREDVKNGKVGVAVVFPPGFGKQASRAMFYGNKPKLTVLFDPTKQMETQIVKGALMQNVMEQVSKAAMSGPSGQTNFEEAVASLDKNPDASSEQKKALRGMFENWQNLEKANTAKPKPEAGSGAMRTPFEIDELSMTAKEPGEDSGSALTHIFAGMAVQGILFWGFDAAMGTLRDKRTGVWKRLRAAPLSKASLLLGKALSSTVIGASVLAVVFGVGLLVFHIQVLGSLIGFCLVGLATAIMTATFGLFVAALGRTEGQSRGLSVLAVLMMSMLGGAWFPTSMMPEAVRTVSMFIPVRWAVDGFDAMAWRGVGLSGAIGPVAGLLSFSAFFAIIAVARFRWNVEA